MLPFVCPDCRAPLDEQPGALRCAACNATFPIIDSVPKLWPPSRAKEIEAQLAAFQDPHSAARQSPFLRALLPPNPICDPGGRKRKSLVKDAMRSGLVLNLGSKDADWGTHVVNVDLVAPPGGHTVAVLADLHRLPFADGTVDGIICTNVLEHVADASACIAEIARVLKPGGHLYVTVPFIFPTHPDPLDMQRWTLAGLRHAFRDFDELSAGPCGGPSSAFVALFPTMKASVFSNFFLFNAVRCLLGWLVWPLKFLDHIACLSPRAHMVAAAFHFFGKKRL
jgi:LSD1 subclass zinc finger protein